MSAVFLAAFVGSCGVLHRLMPFPDVPIVRPKLERLASHGDEFDVIFLGSSRVAHQIVPAVFDRAVAESGRKVRSFNAGVPAMVPPEDGYVLDEILQRPHRRLRWVFLELQPLAAQSDSTLAGTGRMDYWHDWPRMWLMSKLAVADCAHAWSVPAERRREKLGQALERWWEHLRLFAENSTNYGRGAALAGRATSRKKVKRSKLEGGGEAGDGWAIPSGGMNMAGQLLADYERAQALLRQTGRRRFADPVGEEALWRKLDTLRARGITPILMIPPTLATEQFFPERLRESGVVVLDFSDPALHPEFYATPNRKDGVHLNLQGAELFSRALAKGFLDLPASPR